MFREDSLKSLQAIRHYFLKEVRDVKSPDWMDVHVPTDSHYLRRPVSVPKAGKSHAFCLIGDMSQGILFSSWTSLSPHASSLYLFIHEELCG